VVSFGSLDRDWLMRFLRHRIADERVLRLIMKWLAAGVIEEGQWSDPGAPASPLLANVYLHHVLDLWADWWRKRHARGDVIIARFAISSSGSSTGTTPRRSWRGCASGSRSSAWNCTRRKPG
jgi:hypothetical protein